jgi:hypothetical protein
LVKAFSSFSLAIEDVERVGELRWLLDARAVREARSSHSPVVLFLFDADTDHGRYLRLDTLPPPTSEARSLAVRLPISATINQLNLEMLIAALQEERSARPA